MLRAWKLKVSVFIICTCVGGLLWMGSQQTLNWALKREAQLVGGDWARHIEDRLDGLGRAVLPDGSWDETVLPKPEELRGLLSGVFGIGHIFQFDYINAVCRCNVSLTAAAPRPVFGSGPTTGHHHPVGADHDPHDHGGGADATTEVRAVGDLPKSFWEHVANSSEPHGKPQSNTSDAYQVPLDHDFVDGIISQKAEEIFIRRGQSSEAPSTYAEIYYPVIDGSKVSYLIRVLVNLDEQVFLYRQLILVGIGAGVLFLSITGGYPTWRYLKAVNRKRRADQRVTYLANHDVLTNLYNRNNFQEKISDIIWESHERRESALIFLLDLNDFKEVNDFYGHPIGDRVLCEFAAMLKDIVPPEGYVARLGGDEFVVVIPGIKAEDIDHRDYLTVPEAVSISINGGTQEVSTSISCGVVRFPQDAESTEELIQLADLALYAAKSDRSGQVYEYEPKLKEMFFDRLKIRDEFRNALRASQIEPYYQPIVNLRTGIVEGFEALARWNHPEKGILTPFVFADVLEDGEISAMLGQLMFEKIADEMAYWKSVSVPFVKVALNVTDGDLKSRSFADDIQQGLRARGLLPENLTIEVTENCLFGSEKALSMKHLEKLRSAGCFIALDDFGTGYSSITQLKELPITTIKIDKSFIDDVLANTNDQAIIAAMLDLGKSMNFDLVMEGIETSSQLALLKWMGSELAQGYFYARPMPAAEVPAFVERQNAGYQDTEVKASSG